MARHLPHMREFRESWRGAGGRFHFAGELLSHLRVCAAILFTLIVILLAWHADVAWPLG